MIDKETLIDLAPHYAAMLLLVFLVLAVVQFVAGDIGFWGELVVVLVVVTLYRPVVQRLGYAPRAWQ